MAKEGIEIELTAEMMKTKEAFSQMTSQLTQTTKALEKLESVISKFGSNASKSIKQASDETKRLGNNASSSIKKLEGFNTISDAFRNAYNMARKTTQGLVTVFKTAIDYSEQLNLFNVVFQNKMDDMGIKFSEVGLRAEKFQQQLHEAFGTNLLETRKYQALFQSMGENMGIVTDKAEIMSTNLTKLSYDIASLYNAEENDVAQAIRAGVYAGQTKPLRRFGIDVTQVSMQPVLDNLGIDKSISELSQAEKQIIRYMSVLKQASVTHGDFANTIESPANQLKILKQQCAEASIALGNLFLGAFAKMLPYANAILMVIKEIAKAIASFFGIKVEDFNSGIAVGVEEFEDLEDSVGGVGDSAGKASKAVKELKRQTLGFDQINNLTTPTPSSGSSGGGGGASGGSPIGGIDQRLLDALKGYENGMEKVRMKANEIRDKIMEWLGFTKEIDPLTGEVSWKFNGIGATLKNIGKHLWEASGTTKVLFGLGIGVALLKAWNLLKKISVISGKSGLTTILTGLLGPTKSLLGYMGNAGMLSVLTKMPNSLKMNVDMWRAQNGILDLATGKVNKMQMALTSIKGALVALGGSLIYWNSFKSIYYDGANLVNVLGAIGGGIATIGGAMTVGASVAGPYGAVIGGVVGALVLLGETLVITSDHYPEHTKRMEKDKKALEDLTTSYNENIKAIERGVDTNMAQLESDRKLVEELESITDGNGHVKEGYEDRANFILGRMKEAYGVEAQMINGTIKNYKEIIKTIYDIIGAKKAEVYFNAYQKEYEESVIASAQAERDLENAIKTKNGIIQEGIEIQGQWQDLADRNKEIEKELATNTGLTKDQINMLSLEYERNEKMMGANIDKQEEIKEKIKEQEKTVQGFTKTYIEAKGKENLYSDMWVAYQAKDWDKVKELYVQGSKTSTKEFTNALIKQAEAVKEGSPLPTSIIEGFRVLAETSSKEYDRALNELPKSTAKQIDEAVKETGKKKKTVHGKSFELGDTFNKAYNESTKETGNKSISTITKDLTSDANKKKAQSSGKTIGNEVLKGAKDITKNGITVKAKANTSGVTDSVRNAVNNYGRGYSATAYVNFKANGSQTFEIRKVGNKALGGIFNNGLWQNIKQYASGGLPNHGTMFTAGERGPEVVGHIGSRTEVLNQSQLASVMYEAVTKAISNSNLGNGIEFYAHTDEGVIIDRINRRTRQTGQCPIEI